MKRFILLEDGTASSTSTSNHSSQSSMIDYSGSAPGGLLFAVYFSPGGSSGLFSSCSSQGIVASPCAIGGALESGVCSFSANIGVEICWLEQVWATAVESAKMAGFVVLLGVGGVLCYKLYSTHRKRIVSGIRAFLCPINFEIERGLVADCEEIEEDVFDLFEIDLSVGLNCLAGDHRPKRKIGKGVYLADRIRTRWRHVTGRREQIQDEGFHRLPIRRGYSTPEGLVQLQGRYNLQHKSAQGDQFSNPFSSDKRNDSFSGLSSEETSPQHAYRFRSYSLSVKDLRFQPESAPWSIWDGSVESFVSGADASEVSRLIRECSIDSDCSEFSLDLPLNEGCGLSTLEVIERIEQEINSVKDNCLAMNHELYTLHDVRPAISNSESELDLSATSLKLVNLDQSSFKGMLNLTAIADEISDTASNASDFSPSHVQLSILSSRCADSDGDGISMEWDNHDLLPTVQYEETLFEIVDEDKAATVLPANEPSPSVSNNGRLLEVHYDGHEWCSQESGYLEWEGTPGSEISTSFTSASILSPLQEKRESDSMSCTTSSYSSCLASPDDYSQDGSTESGVVKRRQWAEASQQNRDSAIFDLGLDLEATWREEAVGSTVQLHHYAQDTWQAPTPRAQAIKQAYIEVERMTGCRRMRKMRGDTYGILRAAMCQMVMKKIPFPQANRTMDCIARKLASGEEWIREWTFGHRLPYGPQNVVQGMKLCLETLQRLAEEMVQEEDPLEVLVNRLNADVVLDTQLMEAIKLHMLGAAFTLELAESLDETLPLFALGLFSRPGCKTVKGLTINYLNPIGDSATLERAEYYLLGYSLGVRIDVYRPTTVGLDGQDNVDLRSSYPDFESFENVISVIEEDERHYSVPVP